MGLGKKLLLITFLAGIAAVVYEVAIKETPTFPVVFFKDHYWGRKVVKAGEPIPKDSTEIRKFVVKIEDSVIQDLKQQLKTTRYVEPLPNSNFNYGFNGAQLKKVVDYWTQTYDWKKQEKEMNKYNHFKTQIEGIDVHFIHVKPAKAAKHTFPLILVHGWPGTFVEYLKSIPLLTNVENDVAFELIIPSLPGYGFSEEPHQQGFSAVHAARVFHKLMTRLGHKKYYYHGGDWGAIIGRFIATMYPENVLGYHTTFLPGLRLNLCGAVKYALTYFIPSIFSDHPQAEMKLLKPFQEKLLFFSIRESGYMHLQSTKPDTIGAALLNSPAGLAAYIMEKFSTWTNREYVNLEDGGLTKHFTYDELLTNVM
ncbi:epoxide hydrolase 1-like protein, partial [Leptotrombidium deliense]